MWSFETWIFETWIFETCYKHVSKYCLGDRNMLLPCFKIHGIIMLRGIKISTMAPIENLTMENNKRNIIRKWMWNRTWMDILDTNI